MSSWLVFGLKPLHLLLVLPLILTRLETSEVAIYYLLLSSSSLISMCGAGFHAAFSRLWGYVLSGLSIQDLIREKGIISSSLTKSQGRDEGEVASVFRFTSRAYLWISLFAGIVAATAGSLFLYEPIQQLDQPEIGWIAWGVVAFFASCNIYTNTYTSFLFGSNAVIQLRRCEFFWGLVVLISNFLVLIFCPSVLSVMMATHLWTPLFLLILRKRSRGSANFPKARAGRSNHEIWSVVWGSSWRGGVGVFASRGLIQLSNLLLAQFVAPAVVASYGLSMSLINAANEFSRAPMVSQIPNLIRLRSQRLMGEFCNRAVRCMLISYMSYVLVCCGILGCGQMFISLIGSDVSLAPVGFLCLMMLAFFLDRFSAMHQQIYGTGNQVISHLTGLGYVILFLITVLFFASDWGIYAFAFGALVGQVGFVSILSARVSYKVLGGNFLSRELRCSFPPLMLLAIACVIATL